MYFADALYCTYREWQDILKESDEPTVRASIKKALEGCHLDTNQTIRYCQLQNYVISYFSFDRVYEFPEKFDWTSLDSRLASELGERISNRIKASLATEERIEVPGLRAALQMMARLVNP